MGEVVGIILTVVVSVGLAARFLSAVTRRLDRMGGQRVEEPKERPSWLAPPAEAGWFFGAGAGEEGGRSFDGFLSEASDGDADGEWGMPGAYMLPNRNLRCTECEQPPGALHKESCSEDGSVPTVEEQDRERRRKRDAKAE